MKPTFLCITSLVLVLVMTVTGQNQPLATTSTAVTTPWTGTATWNGSPTWTGNRAWTGNPTWGGSTQIWNGDQSFNRQFYNPSYNPLHGQTVYCYPLNTPMYRSFLPVPIGPAQEIGSVIGDSGTL